MKNDNEFKSWWDVSAYIFIFVAWLIWWVMALVIINPEMSVPNMAWQGRTLITFFVALPSFVCGSVTWKVLKG